MNISKTITALSMSVLLTGVFSSLKAEVYPVLEFKKEKILQEESEKEVVKEQKNTSFKHSINLGAGFVSSNSFLFSSKVYNGIGRITKQEYEINKHGYFLNGSSRFRGLDVMHLDYGFQPLKWLEIGVSYSLSHTQSTLFKTNGNKKIGTLSQQIHSIDIMARFFWLNRKYVRMYSAVALGGAIIDEKMPEQATSVLLPIQENYKYPLRNKIWGSFSGYCSPVGIRIGTFVYGFLELGFGNRGVFSFGIGCTL